jgi:hypothetical protein
MHLYEINPSDHHLVHVVARTSQEAVDVFITWSAANGRVHDSFTVDDLPIENLHPDQQDQVRRAFAAGLAGIAHFDEELGWTFSPPIWQPLGNAAPSLKHLNRLPTAMRLFDFRDTGGLSAVVLAADPDDATEIFEEYVFVEGGDFDSLLWREITIADLQDGPLLAVFRNAMQLDRQGLVVRQAEDRWVFIILLSNS